LKPASKAKYLVVQEAIQQWIRDTHLVVGSQLPKEDELATRFGVGRQTIRQAVGNLVASGMLSREQGRGTFYRGESLYRPPKNSSPKLIGVVVTYLTGYIFPSIIRGIEERLSSEGYALMLQSTGNDVANETRSLELLVQQGAEGLIVEPTRSLLPNANEAFYQELQSRGMPLVMINTTYDGIPSASVTMDDVAGGRMATEYLLSQGHQAIGVVMKLDDKQGAFRLQGMLSALVAHRVEFRSDWARFFTTEGKTSVVNHYAKVFSDAKVSERPTAIFCYNDEIAVGLIKQLHQYDLSVPEDVSVLGYDDSEIGNVVPHGLTTIAHPKIEMGRAAAELLIQQLHARGEPVADRVFVPQLVERGTVVYPLSVRDLVSAP